MNLRHPHPSRLLFPLVLLLLAMALLTGGGSQDRGWGDAATQLLAWPVLLLAAWQLTDADAPRNRPWLLALAAVLPLGIALQWLVGLTLTPWATERALWAVLPAVAAFTAALALPRRDLATLAWPFAGMAGASLLLGYLQLGAPQDSPLNPFPEWPPALNGLFANPNHQATSIAVALVLILAWLLHRDDDDNRDGRWWAKRVALAGLALFLLVGLPLTGSRAAVLIAAAALLAVPLANGWLGRRRRRGSRLGLAAAIAGGVFAMALLLAASAWLRVDRESESRSAVYAATARMAGEAMPAGTGIGSFVPWVEAHAPDALVSGTYFNHAHNEYLQWWLEGGIAGLAWIALLVAFVAWTRPRPGRGRRPHWLAVGSWLGLVVMLAHSAVDYPLRTPALMTVAALLAGTAAALRSPREGRRRHDDGATIQAGNSRPAASMH
ncbi:O-antigen ligase family protein [Pseudoxanthomonas koreensis]|uniref:O-antigen ligase family protein n=1 Tax=Pseudoxanthomonas koreensis TaxID=266061 RepID=UPI0013910340|nr:O-antigen ligase family protein [Pseudoxanthomonas koreensis]